jgi:immunoglobulin-like protein involved in spore germination/sporulation and spore germination protein
MRRLTLLIAVMVVVAAGCGSSHRQGATETRTVTVTTPTPAPTTSTSVTSTVAAPATLRVYLLRDGKVAPVSRTVAATRAVAAAALAALNRGPTADERRLGFTTAVPPRGGDAPSIAVANGVATLALPPNVTRPELAQIVYTLTQFPTVHAVRSSRMLGDTAPLTRRTFEDLTPPILVESPLPGESVTSPLAVRGTANTFEATFNLEMRNSSGVPVATRFVTATSGSGERGTFDTTFSFPHTGGPLTLVAYEQSAANGKRIHVVRIPLQEG